MKKLTLIRHAKSSWNNPINDFKRPIIEEGIQKTIKVATETKKLFNDKSLIWISPAERTRQTAKLFLSIWGENNEMQIQFKENLYTFDLNQLEKIVKSCSNEFKSLILFGHNGAITDFVNKFGNIFIDNVPTSGYVSIIFECDDWNKINKGKTEKIIFPRDI
ncbi:SixA phosphatase family protein [Flavobacterium chungnamense]|uniref:Histidine phosphatase family protein n=1 Tax=Flavobacterium chungnamense TaxID=706182 RepID=A0ABP7UZP4_9FLAO